MPVSEQPTSDSQILSFTQLLQAKTVLYTLKQLCRMDCDRKLPKGGGGGGEMFSSDCHCSD